MVTNISVEFIITTSVAFYLLCSTALWTDGGMNGHLLCNHKAWIDWWNYIIIHTCICLAFTCIHTEAGNIHVVDKNGIVPCIISFSRQLPQQRGCCCVSMLGQTGGRTLYRYVRPVPHTVRAMPTIRLNVLCIRRCSLGTVTRCLHFTASCTTSWVNYMQMSPAKRRLSGPTRTLMTSLGWRVQQGGCVDTGQ